MESAVIRAAASSDIDAIAPLMQAYWQYEKIDGFDIQRIRGLLARYLASPSLGRVWVAQDVGPVVGYLLCPFGFSFEYGGLMAEIDEFFVEVGARKRGIGRALVALAKSDLAKAGCVAIQLQVARNNDPAQHFYSRLGFRSLSGYEIWIASNLT